MARGPAAWCSALRPLWCSCQKHSTVRNTSNSLAPRANRWVCTLPSGCSTATTLLVVPKSIPISFVIESAQSSERRGFKRRWPHGARVGSAAAPAPRQRKDPQRRSQRLALRPPGIDARDQRRKQHSLRLGDLAQRGPELRLQGYGGSVAQKREATLVQHLLPA